MISEEYWYEGQNAKTDSHFSVINLSMENERSWNKLILKRIFLICLLTDSIWFYTHNAPFLRDSVKHFLQSAMLSACSWSTSLKKAAYYKTTYRFIAGLLLRMAVGSGKACNWTMTITHTLSVDIGHSPPPRSFSWSQLQRPQHRASVHDIHIPGRHHLHNVNLQVWQHW